MVKPIADARTIGQDSRDTNKANQENSGSKSNSMMHEDVDVSARPLSYRDLSIAPSEVFVTPENQTGLLSCIHDTSFSSSSWLSPASTNVIRRGPYSPSPSPFVLTANTVSDNDVTVLKEVINLLQHEVTLRNAQYKVSSSLAAPAAAGVEIIDYSNGAAIAAYEGCIPSIPTEAPAAAAASTSDSLALGVYTDQQIEQRIIDALEKHIAALESMQESAVPYAITQANILDIIARELFDIIAYDLAEIYQKRDIKKDILCLKDKINKAASINNKELRTRVLFCFVAEQFVHKLEEIIRNPQEQQESFDRPIFGGRLDSLDNLSSYSILMALNVEFASSPSCALLYFRTITGSLLNQVGTKYLMDGKVNVVDKYKVNISFRTGWANGFVPLHLKNKWYYLPELLSAVNLSDVKVPYAPIGDQPSSTVSIGARLHPNTVEYLFKHKKFQSIVKGIRLGHGITNGDKLKTDLLQILGASITEDVLTSEAIEAATRLIGKPPTFILKGISPAAFEYRSCTLGDAETDLVLCYGLPGEEGYFGILISCKSNMTAGSRSTDTEHLRTWTYNGFQVQSVNSHEGTIFIPSRIVPLRDYFVQPALEALNAAAVTIDSESKPLRGLEALNAAARGGWMQAALSTDDARFKSGRAPKREEHTVLGPQLIDILLALSEFEELNDIIVNIISAISGQDRAAVRSSLVLRPTRNLEAELAICSLTPSIDTQDPVTIIANEIIVLERAIERAKSENRTALAECLEHRLQFSLKSHPLVVAKIAEIKAYMPAVAQEIQGQLAAGLARSGMPAGLARASRLGLGGLRRNPQAVDSPVLSSPGALGISGREHNVGAAAATHLDEPNPVNPSTPSIPRGGRG